MQRFLKWLGKRVFGRQETPEPEPNPPRVRVRPPAAAAKRQAERSERSEKPQPRRESSVGVRHAVRGSIEDGGPGKNVLQRESDSAEDLDTQAKLEIIDAVLEEENDGGGIDPYNTGRFDRSKHWDTRSRK